LTQILPKQAQASVPTLRYYSIDGELVGLLSEKKLGWAKRGRKRSRRKFHVILIPLSAPTWDDDEIWPMNILWKSSDTIGRR
jgi:hypothetical protein